MKLKLSIMGLLVSSVAISEVQITSPLMSLTDVNGEVIEGISKSTNSVKAMEKASTLPNGEYFLKRPDTKINISNRTSDNAKVSISITRPNMVLVDSDGNRVDGVAGSISEIEAMEKASELAILAEWLDSGAGK